MVHRNLLAGIFLIVFPHLVTAQARDQWSWSGTVPAGGTVQINGILGAIHAVRSSGKSVVVKATKHARRGDVSSVRIEVIPSERGVQICSVYKDEDGAENSACERDRGRGNRDHHGNMEDEVYVDYTVEVPDGVALDARTVIGDVDAEDLRADVDVASVTGDIYVKTTGEVSASTVSGDIRAGIGASKPQHDLDFSTVSGTVTLELPADFSADVHMRSQFGSVESDFEIPVERTRFGHKVRGRIGGGGSTLSISTLSGRINLRRL